ncbi:metalloregulator ArsR/SmtB family transcription factor [Actinophytocola sediminis]
MPDDLLFTAMANPVRRRLLELLCAGSMTAGALADRFALSRPAVSEHLRVLRQAELVREEVRGRERHYHLTAEPLVAVSDWLHPFERYWRDRLRTLSEVLEEESE